MLKRDWLHKTSSAEWLGNVKADIKELAQYFRDQVVKDFQQDPNRRFQSNETFRDIEKLESGLY